MKSKETLNKVKALLGLEINLEERSLENGTRFESEAFESGREVFIISEDGERIAVPAGEYLLDDGMLLVVSEDGIIDEIREEVEVEEEEVVDAAAEVADIEDWRGLEERIKNLEDAVADLKSRAGEKEDFSTDEIKNIEVESTEIELSEVSKPVKHNPEAKSKQDLHLHGQNRSKTTQDVVYEKLFNNN